MTGDNDRKDLTGYRHCRRRWRELPHEYIEGNRCPESGFTLPCALEPVAAGTLESKDLVNDPCTWGRK